MEQVAVPFMLAGPEAIRNVLDLLIHWLHEQPIVPIAYCDPDMATDFDTLPAPWFSLFLVVDGEMIFTVDNRTLMAHAGHLVLLNAHLGNLGEVVGEQARFTCLSFDITRCLSLAGAADGPVLASIPIRDPNYLHTLYKKMSLAFHSPSPTFPHIHLKAAVLEALVATVDMFIMTDKPDGPNIGPHVRRAMQFIEEHQAETNLSLDRIVTASGISVGHLEKQFRREGRDSPMRYLLHLRMQRARNLLTRTNLGIKEIAYSIGFTDPLYFSKLFRRKHGESPRAFRRHYLKEPPEKGRPNNQPVKSDKESTHETH